ncbi:MAG: hypothetical protein JWM16_5470 [Verrucomicrobiales bacterium]|nr:hypothetical protein [Verrucomicrobiales bacterium]
MRDKGLATRRNDNRSSTLCWRAVLLCLAILLLPCPPLQAAAQLAGLKLHDLYEKRSQSDTNRFKSIITSAQAELVGQNLYRGKTVRIDNYTEDGKTNLVVRANDCLLNWKERTATSTNRLELETGNGLQLEGYGFFCQLTNFTLFVSNRVRTRIHRSLAESNRTMVPSLSSAVPAPAGADTNIFLTIYSDHFYLNNASNIIVYTGNVSADNPQAVLSCEELIIQRKPDGTLQSILGLRNVVIVNKADQSRASGDRAFYHVLNEREILDLTGHSLWLEGQRSCRAEAFSFDLQSNTVEAKRKALLQLPRAMFSQAELFPGITPASKTNRNQANYTNQIVEIHSDWMKMQLPGSNHPPRSIIARTNVLLLSHADNVRAAGEEAFYSEGTGLFELNRNASWQADQRLVKGDHLSFDRTNRMFQSKGNSFLRLPLASFGNQSVVGAKTKGKTLQVLEVNSDSIDYQGDWLTFQENVRGKLFEGSKPVAQIQSGFLAVQFSNQVQRFVAKKRVFLEQFPVTKENGQRVGKTLNCANLDVNLTTNGLLQHIVAHGMVRGVQETRRTNKTSSAFTILDADRVTADFFTQTNQVRDIIAEKNVVIKDENRTASGQMAVYTATNNIVLLSGNAAAKAPDKDINIKDADVILWDRNVDRFHFKKLLAEGSAKALKTNQTSLPSSQGPEHPDVSKK